MLHGTVNTMGAVSRVFAGINSVSLTAIPFFILSGYLMEEGNISKEIVNFAKALVGHLTGGLAHVCVVASMIFAAVSGSSIATALAFGNLLVPAMNRQGYEKEFTATLQASAGTIGPIIPPSILMVMYCSIAGISVGALFMAGVIPGILMGVSLMIVSYFYARKRNIPKEERMPWKQKIKVFTRALVALFMPVIIIGGTLSGIVSPTEAGMAACLYGILVGAFVYKGLTWKSAVKAFCNAAISSSTILFLNGMANIMGYQLARTNFPSYIVNIMTGAVSSSIGMVLIIMLFLFAIGMFMETTAAIVIFVPVLYPLAAAYGISPIYFGLLIVLTLVIGQITPPVGVLLSTTSSLLGIKMSDCFKYLVPCLSALLIVLILCIFFPVLSTWLPGLIFG